MTKKIQKSHLCVKIGDNYVTIKKYGRLNINVDDFDSFDVELHKYLEKNSCKLLNFPESQLPQMKNVVILRS